MAKVIELSPPENRGERAVLKYLGENLSESYLVLGNVWVRAKGGDAQVDALVLGHQGAFILEVKDWKGRIRGGWNYMWQKDNESMENPCPQTNNAAKKFRTLVRENARELFGDKRLFYALQCYAFLVFVNPQADTREVKVTCPDPNSFFRTCTRLEQLAPTIHACADNTKRFLTVPEIGNIAEFLGAPKEELDRWARIQQQRMAAHLLKTGRCPTCNSENPEDARFCSNCGIALLAAASSREQNP